MIPAPTTATRTLRILPITTVHPWASDGFGRAAAEYERGRPGYPPAAVELLVARMGLGPGRTVVDLAAGTGKLTRLLVPSGARVVAVEPVAAMRELLDGLGAEALAGTAEEIPLPDGSANGVTVAQALHWFRIEEALREIHRILGAGGVLAVLYNEPDRDDPVQRAFGEIVARHRAHAPRRLEGEMGEQLLRSGLFEAVERHEFANEQVLDAAVLLDRAASESSISVLDGASREAALAAFEELASSLPSTFVLHYRTDVVVARRS